MPAAMGSAICSMFLTIELSVKSFIENLLCGAGPSSRTLCHANATLRLMNSSPPATKFADIEAMSRALADQITAGLKAAIAARGLASLVVSGGKSPIRLFEMLRVAKLNWSSVCVALADERWVE